MNVAELFPADFVAALEPLRLFVGQTPPVGAHGEHRAPARGAGFDFRDFQAYSPGDDLRRVDWNIYRRTGHVFLRRYDQVQTIPVYVLIDVSASMFFETPSRFAAAARIAAAVASAALRLHDTVEIHPIADGAAPPLRRLTGRARLPLALEYLAGLSPAESVDRAQALRSFATAWRRRGLAIVISDFFDERGVDAFLDDLGVIQHRLLLVRVGNPADAEPAITGELELVDCESGGTRIVSVTPQLLADYRAAYVAFLQSLESFATRRAALCLHTDAAAPPLQQVATVFPSGVLRT